MRRLKSREDNGGLVLVALRNDLFDAEERPP